MSKLFRLLYHIYFHHEQETKVPVEVGELAERTVRIVQCRCAWRNQHHFLFLVMVALCNRADHYIFAVWFLSFFFLLFFLAKSQRSEIGCLLYFHTWCGLSANLECMSQMRCTLLAEIQDAKNAILAPSHNFIGLYLRSWGMYRQSEKNLLNIDTSSTCLHNMVNFGY